MRYLILLLLIIPTLLFAAEPFVEIYKTHDDGMYGRSQDRDIVLSIEETVFERRESIEVDESHNFLTAVTINTEIVAELEKLFCGLESIQMGFTKISKVGDIYTIEDDNIFLSFSFSFEKPNDGIIKVIERHYINLPEVKESVVDHYKDNYVIRIHSAENMLYPEACEITYDEIIIMATIIGDKNQWLWGIHDGNDYLSPLLF